jgi:uncharacterized protein (DUF486 family)
MEPTMPKFRVVIKKSFCLITNELRYHEPAQNDSSMSPAFSTIILLIASNILMTFAWYGHLKWFPGKAIFLVILIAWGIAFFEYCLAVPANRIGYTVFSGFQLKIMQEIITLSVFLVFALTFLGERLTWNIAVSMVLIVAAAWFAFGIKAA